VWFFKSIFGFYLSKKKNKKNPKTNKQTNKKKPHIYHLKELGRQVEQVIRRFKNKKTPKMMSGK